MKLHVLSDLHLGCAPFSLEVRGDVLVLAGDITDGRLERVFSVAEPYLRLRLPVLFVPGNHEFYGNDIARELLRLWRHCRRFGVELLHNRTITLNGTRFIGTTLWTDFNLNGNAELVRGFAKRAIADYSAIVHRGRLLTPEATERFHRRSLRYLRRVLANQVTGPTVVISHHAPHPKSIHARFERNPLNPVFVSDLSELLSETAPQLWIHGHVHNRFDYLLGNTRVVANPRGYDRQLRFPDGKVSVWPEHPDFDPGLIIEL